MTKSEAKRVELRADLDSLRRCDTCGAQIQGDALAAMARGWPYCLDVRRSTGRLECPTCAAGGTTRGAG